LSALPSDSVISGIEVSYVVQSTLYDGGSYACMSDIQLIKGISLSNNLSPSCSANYWPAPSESQNTAGGTSNLWGLTWGATDINSQSFGVRFRALTNSSTSGYLSQVSIRITYNSASISTGTPVTTGGTFSPSLVYQSTAYGANAFVVRGQGTESWGNLGQLYSKNSNAAYTYNSTDGTSMSLYTLDFQDFNIPSGATILGMEVVVSAYSNSLGCVSDVRLVKNFQVQSVNRGQGSGCSTTFFVFNSDSNYFTDNFYGGKTDLWGGIWTRNDLMSPGFGVVLNAEYSYDANIDAIGVSVYYSGGAGFATTGTATTGAPDSSTVYTVTSSPSNALGYTAGIGGSVDWNYAYALYNEDNSGASCPLNTANGTSDYLLVLDYGFEFLPNVVVTGIEVRVVRQSYGVACTSKIRLVNNGAFIGTGKGKGIGCTNTLDLWGDGRYVSETYGGPGDTWGLSFVTGTSVNSESFGVGIQVEMSTSRSQNTNNGYAYIDFIEMNLYYTTQGGGAMSTTGFFNYQITSWNYPTVATQPTSSTDAMWNYIDGIKAEDNSGSSASGLVNGIVNSTTIDATGFNIIVPVGMQVLGIEARIRGESFYGVICVAMVQLRYDGNLVGNIKGNGYNCSKSLSGWGENRFRDEVFGGLYDTWGYTWDRNIVGAGTFGVSLQIVIDNIIGDNNPTAYIDSVSIRVAYGIADSTTAPLITSGGFTTGRIVVSGGSTQSTASTEGESTAGNKSGNIVPIAAGAGGGGVVLIVIIIIIAVVVVKKKKKNGKPNGDIELQTQYKPVEKRPETGTGYVTLGDKNGSTELPPSQNSQARSSINVDQKLTLKFADIKLLNEIGSGSFGKVYKGEWQRTEVAIKVCAHMETSKIQEFLAEASIMLSLRPHPNVLQIFGVSVDGPHPAIVVEFCLKGSLDKIVYGSETISQEFVLKVIKGTALGMLHLHKNGLIHRDIATRNILLNAAMEPKISDFGLSRFLENKDAHQTFSSALPVRWMAPECMENRTFTTASDVYAWGVMITEIYNRQIPFPDLDLIGVITAVRDKGQLPAINSATVPEFVLKLLDTCWLRDPKQRPTFDQICSTLNNLKVIHDLK